MVVLIPSKEEVLGKITALPKGIKRRLVEKGISFIDLQGTLEQAARTRSPYYKRDIHLNDFGNEVVGRSLADWYRTRRLEPNLQTSKHVPEGQVR